MIKYLSRCLTIVLSTLFMGQFGFAQGPPITADKPIMLGGGSVIVKTLSEIRHTKAGTFVKIPLMAHYLPSANTLLGVHLPFVNYSFSDNEFLGSGQTIGDVALLGKYQFFRKDEMGKTFRLVAKTLQTLPTGNKLGIEGMSTGLYQNYVGIVAGYETLKYGISNELGYNLIPQEEANNELRYKLGFGLPLLKPSYPVNQLNLYFEYQNSWFTNRNDYTLLYAQGIQYAKGRMTYEAAVQFPLIQTQTEVLQRKYSIFLGTRLVL
ncbi:MAG: hypothetical protein ACPGXL_04815 [Chitinophagales bacterium]